MGVVRLAVFAALLLFGAEAAATPERRAVFTAAAAIAAIAFLALVRYSARLNAERRHVRALAEANEQGAARVERDWSRIAGDTWPGSEADDTLSDLSVFGRQSLAALLPAVSPAVGRPRLGAWLANKAGVDEIARRQDGIRELVPEAAFREDMAVFGARAHASSERIAQFRTWASTPSAPLPAYLVAASFVIPALTVLTIVLSAAGVIGVPLWGISVAAAIVIAGMTHARTRERLRPVFELAAAADTYADMLSLIGEQSWKSDKLAALGQSLRSDGGSAAGVCFRRFAAIATWAETIASPMLHVALQVTVLWDLHTARRLDIWRRACGGSVARWLDALGEIESLTALGTLAYDNPDWCYPTIRDGGVTELRAEALGHPLLAARSRVANDVTVGPKGTVQLISGSNMSGKSTLLRAIGLNIVLVRTGAPVCAASLSAPILDILTSIQIHDSLGEGVSYFMAELRRLKTIVDAADGAREAGATPVLYLIDEILRGTNSEERAVAARLIVRRLVEAGAIGVVTTHDLGIFADPSVTPYVDHHHFRETIDASSGEERMSFDYRLQSGPTTSRNALRLLALVGIAEK